MAGIYPEVNPYDHGMLDVGDGNRVYWEVCGNPGGKPAVVLHGGPGSGCTTGVRRYFDPSAYRVVLFDQRGCGRSTPHASHPLTDLRTNTTEHLLSDLEQLRQHLDIERWLMFGGSWGSVLGLVYGERHPELVSGLVLTGAATGRRLETDLITRGLGRIFPEAWMRLRDGVPTSARNGDLAEAYSHLLEDADPAVRAKAAESWCDWETAIEPPSAQPNTRYRDPRFRMAFARIVTHYWRHGSWLEEGIVLKQAGRLAGIPGSSSRAASTLATCSGPRGNSRRAWTGSELRIVDDAGHNFGDPGIQEALVAATDRFSRA